MIILLHIFIALSSIGVASAAFAKPSSTRFMASYGLIAATIASGVYLIAATSSNVLHTCISGLVYLTVVSGLTVAGHVRNTQRTRA